MYTVPSIAQRKRTSKDTKQETRNKTVEHNRGLSSASLRNIKYCFAKHCFGNQTVFDSKNMFQSEHVRNSHMTHGCVHGFIHEVSLINVSTMICLPCALSRRFRTTINFTRLYHITYNLKKNNLSKKVSQKLGAESNIPLL